MTRCFFRKTTKTRPIRDSHLSHESSYFILLCCFIVFVDLQKHKYHALCSISPRPCIRHLVSGTGRSHAPSCSSANTNQSTRRFFRTITKTRSIRDSQLANESASRSAGVTEESYLSHGHDDGSSTNSAGQPFLSAASQLRSPKDFHKAKERECAYPKPVCMCHCFFLHHHLFIVSVPMSDHWHAWSSAVVSEPLSQATGNRMFHSLSLSRFLYHDSCLSCFVNLVVHAC